MLWFRLMRLLGPRNHVGLPVRKYTPRAKLWRFRLSFFASLSSLAGRSALQGVNHTFTVGEMHGDEAWEPISKCRSWISCYIYIYLYIYIYISLQVTGMSLASAKHTLSAQPQALEHCVTLVAAFPWPLQHVGNMLYKAWNKIVF